MAKEALDSSVYQNYLRDLGVLVKEYAFEAKQNASDEETEFSTGYLSGFHRMVSLMQQQAEVFGIPYEEIGIDGIDADEDLV